MKKKKKLISISSIAFTYVGTVVGAGFASGQEILTFFTVYGYKAAWTIALSSIMFIFIGPRILVMGAEFRASSFAILIDRLFGFFSLFVNAYLFFAMMVINVAMLAGAGAIFWEFGRIPYILGVILTGILAILVIGYGIKGISSVNGVIVGAILLFQVLLLAFILVKVGLLKKTYFSPYNSPISLIIKGISYPSFNLILCTGVLVNLGYEFRDKRILKLGGVIGGLILGGMLLISHICLSAYAPEIFHYEIPILYITLNGPSYFSFIYAVILWGGIFTTLIGNLFSMTSFIHERFNLHHIISALVIIFLGIIFSPLGFSSIVNAFYPILGVIGVVFIIAILYTSRKSRFY